MNKLSCVVALSLGGLLISGCGAMDGLVDEARESARDAVVEIVHDTVGGLVDGPIDLEGLADVLVLGGGG